MRSSKHSFHVLVVTVAIHMLDSHLEHTQSQKQQKQLLWTFDYHIDLIKLEYNLWLLL